MQITKWRCPGALHFYSMYLYVRIYFGWCCRISHSLSPSAVQTCIIAFWIEIHNIFCGLFVSFQIFHSFLFPVLFFSVPLFCVWENINSNKLLPYLFCVFICRCSSVYVHSNISEYIDNDAYMDRVAYNIIHCRCSFMPNMHENSIYESFFFFFLSLFSVFL